MVQFLVSDAPMLMLSGICGSLVLLGACAMLCSLIGCTRANAPVKRRKHRRLREAVDEPDGSTRIAWEDHAAAPQADDAAGEADPEEEPEDREHGERPFMADRPLDEALEDEPSPRPWIGRSTASQGDMD